MQRIGLGLALAIALAGCTGGAQQTGLAVSQDAAAATEVALSPADLGQMRETCSAAWPSLVAAISPAAPAPVSGTAIYPQEFCRQLLAGGVPATADRSSLAWLPGVLSKVRIAAQIAGYVLPVVLPLL